MTMVKAINPRTGQTEFIGQEEGGFCLTGGKISQYEIYAKAKAKFDEAKAASDKNQIKLFAEVES